MSKWLSAAKKFEENAKEGSFFESQSTMYALKQIENTFDKDFPQMIFLLGNPGSGKSFLLNYIARQSINEVVCILIDNPFLTQVEFMQRLLSDMNQPTNESNIEVLTKLAVEIFKSQKHIIMIDEAQLLSTQMTEFVRILSDLKVFWFLLAMHKEEGKLILDSPHFSSRAHKKIYLNELLLNECKQYLQNELQSIGLSEFARSFSKKLIKLSYTYSGGNFRNYKKIYYNLFLLLDTAQSQNKTKFLKPSETLLKMSAIKSGLIKSTTNNESLDDLYKNAKKSLTPNRNFLLLFATILLFAVIIWLYKNGEFDEFLLTQQSDQKLELKPEKTQIKQEKIEEKTQTKEQIEPIKLHELEVDDDEIQRKKIAREEYLAKIRQELQAQNEPEPEPEQILEPNLPKQESNLSNLKPKEKPTSFLNVSSKNTDINSLIKQYDNFPQYKNALEIANFFYLEKQYAKASTWAKKANKLNREEAKAWILYAKSEYAQGNKKLAISSLKLFLQYKNSQEANLVLNEWQKENQ